MFTVAGMTMSCYVTTNEPAAVSSRGDRDRNASAVTITRGVVPRSTPLCSTACWGDYPGHLACTAILSAQLFVYLQTRKSLVLRTG